MNDVHPIVEKLLEAGVEVTLALVESPYAHKHTTVVCRVHGFYQHTYDYVNLHPKMFLDGDTPKQGFEAHHAYHDTKEIRSFRDLVVLNFKWWKCAISHKAQYGQEQEPIPAWASLYEELGLVKKETTTRYVPC